MPPKIKSLVLATHTNKVAKTGVLQGDATNPKVNPNKYERIVGEKSSLIHSIPPKLGKLKGMISNRFNPIKMAITLTIMGKPIPICP